MTITTETNRKRETITYAEGVVEKIYIKEAKPNKYDITHRAGIKIAGQEEWVNIDLKTKEGYEPRIQFNADDKWQTLNEGDEVVLELKVGEWNGKPTYTTTSSRITVTKKGSGAAAPAQRQSSGGGTPVATGSGQSYTKRDDSGIRAGNAFNCAALLVANHGGDLYEIACDFVDAADALKRLHKDDGDDYTVGARVGMALLYAAARTDSVDEAIKVADGVLNTLVPEIVEYAKTGTRKEKEEEKKVTTTRTKKKVEVAEDDLDDEIPF